MLNKLEKLFEVPKISPHLIIYKAQVASLFSILQRMSGILLFLLVVLYFIADTFLYYGSSYIFIYKVVLFCFSLDFIFFQVLIWFIIISLMYHILNGFKLILLEYFLGSAKYKGIVLNLGGNYLLSYLFLLIILLLSVYCWYKIIFCYF